MHDIRKLRRARGLTITDLALLTGISARNIGAFELGTATLDGIAARQLALALDIPITTLLTPTAGNSDIAITPWRRAAAAALVAAAILGVLPSRSSDAKGVALALPRHAAPSPTATPIVPTSVVLPITGLTNPLDLPTIPTLTPALLPTNAPIATAIPTATLSPEEAALPYGCPLLAEPSRIVINQGYGVGSHAPASIAGAIDIGIDTNGDGISEPDATAGTVILATQSGIIKVYPDTWPGGNVVRVINEQSGWTTLYAHLATFSVVEGQPVQRGQPIGIVGTTGMSTGPHLHYETWFRGENRDPMEVIGCWK